MVRLLLLALLLAACRHDFPASDRGADVPGRPDAPRPERPRETGSDHGPFDRSQAEADRRADAPGLDRRLADVGRDGNLADGKGPDKKLADGKGPDQKIVDSRADRPGLDRGPDKPAGPACTVNEVPGTRRWIGGGKGLVVCEDPGKSLTQKSALSHCALPWKLCTPGEYEQHFPMSVAAPSASYLDAWLAACVDDYVGAAYQAVYFEAVCVSSNCQNPVIAYTPASVAVCPPFNLVPTTYPVVGLISSSTCVAVGLPSGAKKPGWWAMKDTCTITAPAIVRALCCHP